MYIISNYKKIQEGWMLSRHKRLMDEYLVVLFYNNDSEKQKFPSEIGWSNRLGEITIQAIGWSSDPTNVTMFKNKDDILILGNRIYGNINVERDMSRHCYHLTKIQKNENRKILRNDICPEEYSLRDLLLNPLQI